MPSYKTLGSKSEPNSPERTTDHSSTLSIKLPTFARYNLWPRPKKQQPEVTSPVNRPPLPERSPSSLSDNAIPTSRRYNRAYPGGNLANRRKISVPELREKPAPDSFDTLDPIIDSPTIPGRPALRSISSHLCLSQHERSKSFPEEDDQPRIHDHISTLLASPSVLSSKESPILSPTPAWPLPSTTSPSWKSYHNTSFNPTRPLSPILSPAEGTTPVPGSPVHEIQRPATPPPRVPPKSAGIVLAAPITPPPRKESLQRRPSLPVLNVETPRTPRAMGFPQVYASLPPSPPRERSNSPQLESPVEAKPTSIMERGRPTRKKSNHNIRKAPSPKQDTIKEEEYLDYATLPTGLKPLEACVVLPPNEREKLAKQACSQAERFEVLPSSQVTLLSTELRNLDERCEYLRKNYKSLRQGRQKLHNRLLLYLKSDLTFSKDRLLKQEEALEELDHAIDEWATKLDRAENRRLRVRQKLLEHVAAAMMLKVNTMHHHPAPTTELTPPGSREGSFEQDRSQSKHRSGVESIKIYADTQVLNLFSDIEQAIGRMCEASA